MIIAMPEAGVVTLVRQFRYPLGRHFIELPAGKIAGQIELDALVGIADAGMQGREVTPAAGNVAGFLA